MPVACVLVITFQNFMSRMSDFADYISSLLKKGYLRQPFVKSLQQLNDYRENDLVLKLVDDFLASHYASLTTKSSHFVWSITRAVESEVPSSNSWQF